MSDTIVHTARSFADYYGISRERLARIIAISLRERGGVFGIAGYGYFRAELVAPKRMEITPYTVTRAAADAIPLYPLKGTLNPASPDTLAASSVSTSNQPVYTSNQPASSPASSAAQSDAPTKHDLELQIMQERATALRQKNILEQARLRNDTVSYCSAALQILLKNLRADLDSLSLAPDATARIRAAIDTALADLVSVLPSIIEGRPVERIELELSELRADRISASRQLQPQAQPQAQTEEDRPAS